MLSFLILHGSGLLLWFVYVVIQFRYSVGKLTGSQQFQFYMVFNINKQRNAASKYHGIHKQPVTVNQVLLNE